MSKIKYWTTKKIEEVLSDPYGRSEIGTDFEELLPELQAELWERQNREAEKRFKQELKAYNYDG